MNEAVNEGYTVDTEYKENVLFKKAFGATSSYDEANRFLEIGDANTYVVTDDTTFLYYYSFTHNLRRDFSQIWGLRVV